MKCYFEEKEMKYNGVELAPHWIYKKYHIKGDAIIGFIGECDVKIEHMVDLEDHIENAPIYSPKMLNFIIEHFNIPLTEGVLRQRMLICIIKEVLETMTDKKIIRDGDDLRIDGGKLSVSIAGKSINSVLIHTGLNITTENTPVHTSGLTSDLSLNNIKEIAELIMQKYSEEIKSIADATCKVRGII